VRRLVTAAALGLSSLASAGPGRPILGGTPAQPGDYPSVVAIEVAGKFECTGTLITAEWVLTAAHCISPAEFGMASQQEVTQSIRVHIGTVDLGQSQGMIAMASDSILDPGFELLGPHDGGLIQLSSTIADVVPARVNFDASAAPVGVSVAMVGFGTTVPNGPVHSGVEYVVQQTSVSCNDDTQGSNDDLLCFDQSGGMGECNGDSGGPSFAMIDGNPVEVGITSFGDFGCRGLWANTRVDAESELILQHVPELGCRIDSECADMTDCIDHQCISRPGAGGCCDARGGGGGASAVLACALGTLVLRRRRYGWQL
jgi:hypothetical protein